MPHSIVDPFSGETYEACSYAMQMKAEKKPADMSEYQWESSKHKGSFGVAQGKYEAGELPDGDAFAFKTVELHGGKKNLEKISFHGESDLIQVELRVFYNGVEAVSEGYVDYLDADMFEQMYFGSKTLQFVGPKGKLLPKSAVNLAEESIGKLTDEDMATMFVKTKDDYAKAKGINIKGANPELDKEVFDSLSKFTGYSAEDVTAKIERYKASGKKLSSLKKQVLSGKKVVPTPPAPGSTQEAFDAFKKAVKKPNVIDASAKATVETTEKAVDDLLAKSMPKYTDEELTKAFIKAKDTVVALFPEEGFSLYTPVDGKFKDYIFKHIKVTQKIDIETFTDVEKALAQYKSTGKKLSQLKKKMVADGEMTAEASTFAKPKVAAKPKATKTEIAEKADAGYTPPGASPYSLSPADEEELFAKLKNGIYAKGSEDNLYYKFSQVAIEMEVRTGSEVSVLDVIRAYDKKKAAQLGIENGAFYEKKIASWASTPQGEKFILEQKTKAIAEKASLEAKKKFLEDLPDLPADSALFREISREEAVEMQAQMGRWSQEGRAAYVKYTGSSYREINAQLREGRFGKASQYSVDHTETIRAAQKDMMPSTRPIILKRGTKPSQFGVNTPDDMYSLVGQELEEKGFLSTSADGPAAFGGTVMMDIEAPVGSAMAWVMPVSQHAHEREMMVAAGTRFKILQVKPNADGGVDVRVRLIPGSHHL